MLTQFIHDTTKLQLNLNRTFEPGMSWRLNGIELEVTDVSIENDVQRVTLQLPKPQQAVSVKKRRSRGRFRAREE